MAETEEVHQDQEAAEQFFYTHGYYPTWYTGVRTLSYAALPAYTAGVRALPAATYAYAGYPYAAYPYSAYPYAYHPNPYAGLSLAAATTIKI